LLSSIILCAFVDLLNTACIGIFLNNEDGEDAKSFYIFKKIVLLLFGNKNEMFNRTGISKVLPNLRNVYMHNFSHIGVFSIIWPTNLLG
jgi:hypothetical protein